MSELLVNGLLVILMLLPLAVWSTTRTVPRDSYALKAQRNITKPREVNLLTRRVVL